MKTQANTSSKLRINRATINQQLYNILEENFSEKSTNQLDLNSGMVIQDSSSGQPTQGPNGNKAISSTWFKMRLHTDDSSSIEFISGSDELQNPKRIERKIISETTEPNVTYTIDYTDMDYGVANSGIWCTKQLLRASDEILNLLEELEVTDSRIDTIKNALTQATQIIDDYEPTKKKITQLVQHQDVDSIESLTEVTIPENIGELRELSYGDNSPPVPRGFILNSERVEIEYQDEEVTLFRGSKDEYNVGMLVGVDDGGAFYHPMPRSLRIDNPDYEIDREDIRDLMAYDIDWNKGQKIDENVWNRIQGDLLLKRVDQEDIIEKYQRIAICDIVDESVQRRFISQSEIAPIDNQVRFKTIVPRNLPKITVSYPRGPARRTIENDLRALMELNEEDDPGHELVSRFIDWIVENHNVAREADKLYETVMEESPERSFGTQLDNHLLMVDSAHVEPEPEGLYREFMPENDNRDFTYFTVDSPTNMNIQHREHDPVPITLPKGTYLLTLARRRNQ